MAAKKKAAATTTGLVAKYKGPSYVAERVIDKAAWKAAGIDDMETMSWNTGNDFTVDVSDLSDEALEILKAEPDIRLSEAQVEADEDDELLDDELAAETE